MTDALTTRETADHAELSAIISDEEIARVHGHANFGPSITPREVVNEGVREYAVGYHSGYTQLTILLEHGLITRPRPGRYDVNLTKKGKKYARVLYRREAALLSEIAALRGERKGLKNRVSCLERLCGEQSTRVMEQATRAKDAERQRDELRKALEPFAALADKFGCWSVVEVCAPEPGNKSPVIQPLPLSAFETAAALIANQGADQ